MVAKDEEEQAMWIKDITNCITAMKVQGRKKRSIKLKNNRQDTLRGGEAFLKLQAKKEAFALQRGETGTLTLSSAPTPPTAPEPKKKHYATLPPNLDMKEALLQLRSGAPSSSPGTPSSDLVELPGGPSSVPPTTAGQRGLRSCQSAPSAPPRTSSDTAPSRPAKPRGSGSIPGPAPPPRKNLAHISEPPLPRFSDESPPTPNLSLPVGATPPPVPRNRPTISQAEKTKIRQASVDLTKQFGTGGIFGHGHGRSISSSRPIPSSRTNTQAVPFDVVEGEEPPLPYTTPPSSPTALPLPKPPLPASAPPPTWPATRPPAAPLPPTRQ